MLYIVVQSELKLRVKDVLLRYIFVNKILNLDQSAVFCKVSVPSLNPSLLIEVKSDPVIGTHWSISALCLMTDFTNHRLALIRT